VLVCVGAFDCVCCLLACLLDVLDGWFWMCVSFVP